MRQQLTPRRFGAVAAAVVTLALTLTAPAHAWTKGALKNLATGQCLRDHPDRLVDTGPCDGSKSTLWTRSQYDTGWSQWRNATTNWCLDDSTAYHLRTYPCHANNEGDYRAFQSWRPSGMQAGVPYVQRWQNDYTWQCLEDSTAHGLRTAGCLSHTDPGWTAQAWRFSYRDSG